MRSPIIQKNSFEKKLSLLKSQLETFSKESALKAGKAHEKGVNKNNKDFEKSKVMMIWMFIVISLCSSD